MCLAKKIYKTTQKAFSTGAATISAIAWVFAYLILPETRGRPLWDTLDEMLLEEKEREIEKQRKKSKGNK